MDTNRQHSAPQQPRQSRATTPKQPKRHAHLTSGGGQITSPWVSAYEGAILLRVLGKDGQPSADGFIKWAQRHGIVAVRRGERVRLYAKADLERALQPVHDVTSGTQSVCQSRHTDNGPEVTRRSGE